MYRARYVSLSHYYKLLYKTKDIGLNQIGDSRCPKESPFPEPALAIGRVILESQLTGRALASSQRALASPKVFPFLSDSIGTLGSLTNLQTENVESLMGCMRQRAHARFKSKHKKAH